MKDIRGRFPGPLPVKTFTRGINELSSQLRLDDDVDLQDIFLHLHKCGPVITALAVATMLDRCGISSRALGELLDWKKINPRTCVSSFNYSLPSQQARPLRQVDHLRVVSPKSTESET